MIEVGIKCVGVGNLHSLRAFLFLLNTLFLMGIMMPILNNSIYPSFLGYIYAKSENKKELSYNLAKYLPAGQARMHPVVANYKLSGKPALFGPVW